MFLSINISAKRYTNDMLSKKDVLDKCWCSEKHCLLLRAWQKCYSHKIEAFLKEFHSLCGFFFIIWSVIARFTFLVEPCCYLLIQLYHNCIEAIIMKWLKKSIDVDDSVYNPLPLCRSVFFNLGSAEPTGSAKIFLGSSKYLNILLLLFTYVKVPKKCKYCYAKLSN